MTRSMFPKYSLLLPAVLAMCLGETLPLRGVTASDNPSGGSSDKVLFTVSPAFSYAAVFIASGQPEETLLEPIKITNSGRVLLGKAGRSTIPYVEGGLVGGRWYQGEFHQLLAPVTPFTTYAGYDWVEQSVGVMDMNDHGVVVGVSENFAGRDEDMDGQFDDYGLTWPDGDSAPTRMANEVASNEANPARMAVAAAPVADWAGRKYLRVV